MYGFGLRAVNCKEQFMVWFKLQSCYLHGLKWRTRCLMELQREGTTKSSINISDIHSSHYLLSRYLLSTYVSSNMEIAKNKSCTWSWESHSAVRESKHGMNLSRNHGMHDNNMSVLWYSDSNSAGVRKLHRGTWVLKQRKYRKDKVESNIQRKEYEEKHESMSYSKSCSLFGLASAHGPYGKMARRDRQDRQGLNDAIVRHHFPPIGNGKLSRI